LWSVEEEIEDVPARFGLALVQFRISATGTGDGDEPFVLYVEQFCEIPSGCLELVRFEVGASTFRTDILLFFHAIHYTGKAGNPQRLPDGKNPPKIEKRAKKTY
jgi:hypothetical protein